MQPDNWFCGFRKGEPERLKLESVRTNGIHSIAGKFSTIYFVHKAFNIITSTMLDGWTSTLTWRHMSFPRDNLQRVTLKITRLKCYAFSLFSRQPSYVVRCYACEKHNVFYEKPYDLAIACFLRGKVYPVLQSSSLIKKVRSYWHFLLHSPTVAKKHFKSCAINSKCFAYALIEWNYCLKSLLVSSIVQNKPYWFLPKQHCTWAPPSAV